MAAEYPDLNLRDCHPDEITSIGAVINDGAQAYKGIIPADRWAEPYMPLDKLRKEIEAGVQFSGAEVAGALVGVMGIQHVQDVTLIRHAYLETAYQGLGIGGALLKHLRSRTKQPILIGTWRAAIWAIGFYEKHGFELVRQEEIAPLLSRYWDVPDRQVETSVVLRERPRHQA